MKSSELSDLLKKYIVDSKLYFNFNKKSSLNSGEYFSHMWTARSNKDKAKSLFPKKENCVDFPDDLLQVLCSQNAIKSLKIEDGDYKCEHYLFTPIALELIRKLENSQDIELDPIILSDLIRDATAVFYQKVMDETFCRIQKPLLESEELMEKSAIFALFLLLTGAVSKETALILQEDENKEILFQDALVDYLNNLYREIFTDFGVVKSKQFSVGDFSNFIRRNKDLRVAYGELFKKEDKIIYFNLYDNQQLRIDHLNRVISITISRLAYFINDDELTESSIRKVLEDYRFNSPLKQSHKRALFSNQMDFKYGVFLEDAIKKYFENNMLEED